MLTAAEWEEIQEAAAGHRVGDKWQSKTGRWWTLIDKNGKSRVIRIPKPGGGDAAGGVDDKNRTIRPKNPNDKNATDEEDGKNQADRSKNPKAKNGTRRAAGSPAATPPAATPPAATPPAAPAPSLPPGDPAPPPNSDDGIDYDNIDWSTVDYDNVDWRRVDLEKVDLEKIDPNKFAYNQVDMKTIKWGHIGLENGQEEVDVSGDPMVDWDNESPHAPSSFDRRNLSNPPPSLPNPPPYGNHWERAWHRRTRTEGREAASPPTGSRPISSATSSKAG